MQKIVGIIETYVKEKDFNYPDSLQKLKNLAFSDVYWDKIIKIEEVHKNCYVYDIGTEDGHFIICNGNLIVHNSQILQHCSQIAHRSVYTSGKGASAAGLCVSKDTKIFYNGSVQPISKIVESQISKNPIRYYNDTMAYIINENKYNSILHCNNFKIQEQSISRFWKITSPKKLCKIDCKTGKSLTLTPQTPLLTINPEDGLVWKPASKLKSGEFVAILKKLSLSNSKNIPTLYTILKSYPGNITLLKLPDIIKNLISKLNKKFGISISDIASDLGILDHKINAWQSDVSKGKIIIKHLIFLCEKANCDINNILPDFVNIETKRGQTIKIPKNVDFDWFYMLGLLIGDISIGSEFQDQCYNEGSIGFSNPDEYNLSYFSKFFSKLDLIPNITSKCDNQRREYHIHSKIIHYIFKYFGLPVISKSKKIKANWDILGYPPEYLYSFLTGLYDANGWILTKKDNFSHIVYSSFSKELSEFIQYALSTLGIISNLNIIQPKKTNKKEDSENTGRFQQYEISFSNYGDFLIFKDKIGFNHPEKNKELEKYCNKKNNFELNIDHIPYIRPTLKEIGEFYDVVNQDKVDFKRYFSSINESVSQKKLKEILNIIEPEWKNHKVQLPYELRNSFYLDLKRTYSKQEIKEKMDISESKLSDYFLRKTKDNSIPISIFTKFLDDDSVLFTSRLRILFESIISEILDKHEIFKEKNKLLDSLSKSEIYWDEISNIQFIDSKDDFVYDLTVPESHNFIANLFVTHNTAAVVKENDNVGMQLEAGALVLASGGTACTTGRSSFIQEDGTIMTFHDLFKNFKEDHVIIYPKFKILGMDEDTLKIKPFNIKHAFKQKTNKKLFRIMTQSGREIDLTEDNEMFISKNSCFQWIETKDLKIGDYIAVPKFLSLKNKDNYTENFAYIAGLIASDGHIQFSKRRGRVDFYNSNQGLLKKYKCLLNDQNYPFYEYIRKPKEEAKIKSKLNNHQITVNRKKFASDLIKFGIPAGNKSSKFSISWKIMQYSDNTILNFIGGVFDGDGSIRSSLNSIYITSGLEKNARLFQLLLLRFGILSKIYNTKNEWFNEITGRNRVKQFCELIHSHHPKKRSLMLKVKELSIKDRIDILPNHQKKFEEIKLDFKGKLGKEYYKYVWNYCKEGVSPSIFHLKQLNDYLYDEYFEKIIDSHILWDQIIDITPIEEEFVYDFKMEETNNFVSNNFIQHNCIDEFDKMRVQDRSAIHEAMEQQSYHPKFELTFANKLTVEIGTFVDELFSKYPNRQIEGKDCEILSMEGLNYKVISTDFKDIKNIPVNRVSRHKAPDHLFNITYSNGRSILVTPEHPIFTIGQDCEIITKDASEIEINSFIPAAKDLHYNCNLELDCDVYEGTKEVRLPSYLNLDLAKFLGYFVTEGYSYSGSSAEIGLSNTDPRIINEMIENIQNTFGVDPIDNTEKNRTIRIISLNIYNYLEKNFPEIMNKSYEKRIPYQVFGLDEGARIAFLRAAFDGDGGVESTSLAYYTSSERLAYDYQDLLLTLGFHSRILSELYTFGENYQQSRLRYKIYIRGDSIKDFCEKVIPHVLENLNLQEILQKNQNSNRKHDVLPAFTANIIIKCLKLLGLSDDGYFDTHLKKNHGINREIIDSRIDLLTYQLEKISSPTDQINTVKEIREFLGYSQQKIADLIGITRENIDYCENGGYTPEKRAEIVRNIKGKIPEIISQAQSLIEKLENLKKFRWLRIKDINMLENKGDIKTEWVYDVTIEPTECFISHGVVLHNTVSIAKAGIVATLQSRTSIIAAANPKDGRWDDFVPALENVNLSPPIRSRFDLILKVRDIPNQNEDDRVAEHILRNHMEGLEEMLIEEDSELEDGEQKNSQDIITMDLLQKYIRYARGNFHPRLTKSAAKKIQEFYVEMRNSNNDSSAVAIVARNLESLVRMCEAYAKMALQEYVRDKDVDAVLEIEMQHLKDIGFDEETGSYDVDILQTGKSANARKKAKIINRILDFIKELQKNNPDPFEFDDIAEPLILEGIEEEIIKEALDQWTASGTLYQPTNHTYSLVTPRKKKNKH